MCVWVCRGGMEVVRVGHQTAERKGQRERGGESKSKYRLEKKSRRKKRKKFDLQGRANCCRLIVNEVSVMNNPLICVYCECIYLMKFFFVCLFLGLHTCEKHLRNESSTFFPLLYHSTLVAVDGCCHLLCLTGAALWLEQQNLFKMTGTFFPNVYVFTTPAILEMGSIEDGKLQLHANTGSSNI